jgi:hypothetical protein
MPVLSQNIENRKQACIFQRRFDRVPEECEPWKKYKVSIFSVNYFFDSSIGSYFSVVTQNFAPRT